MDQAKKLDRCVENVTLIVLAVAMIWLTYAYECGDLLFICSLIISAIVSLFMFATIPLWHPTIAREVAVQRREWDSRIICPQCQTKGCVSTKAPFVNMALGGGKTTAALVGGDLSGCKTRATCSNCGSVWHF
jgi:hypothetical protein